MLCRLRCLPILVALVVGCGGGGSLKQAGEECVASTECDVGLVCNFGASPHVCAATTSIDAHEVDAADVDADLTDGAVIDAPPATIDARPPIDAPPGIDAPVIDAPPPIDAPAIDAPPPIDAAEPIDASPDA